MNPSQIHFAFFGTPEVAVYVLDELSKQGFAPSVVITAPDAPQGRNLVLTPPLAKVWAENHGIPVLQPESVRSEEFFEALKAFEPEGGFDIFVVAAYGKIIPKKILEIPKHGTLNVHPSLLPKHRGPSPIQSAILEDDSSGVSIMLLDEEMDHGPILGQKEVPVSPWPPRLEELEAILSREGGKMLCELVTPWIEGSIQAKEQDHSKATFCRKIDKSDGLIDLGADPEANFRKIRAFSRWPGAYFFLEKDGRPFRIIIKDAELTDGKLRITRIIPEGKKEMNYDDFMRNFRP